MKSVLFGLMVGLVVFAGTAAFAADVPDTLTIDDLVGHPERWPATVTLTTNIRVRGGPGIAKGQSVRVLSVTAKGVLTDVGTGAAVGVPTAGCDLMEKANEGWAKLTPAQRALDAAAIMKDASLWPDTVKARRPVKLDGPLGMSKTFPPGTPMMFACYDDQGVYLMPPGFTSHVNLKFEGTDLIQSARERVLIDPAQRKSRIVEGLREIMQDSNGKPLTNSKLDDTKVFVLFYGANWCPPCHQLSPVLVKWFNEYAAKNPHMTMVLMDGDERDAEMTKYMKEEKMPWPGVAMADWKKIPVFAANRREREAWPQVLITDKYGKIIYNEEGGGPSDIKLHMEALAKLDAGGAAK